MTSRQPQLCLGTVQMGLAYGIAGSGARISDAEAAAILAQAWDRGIRRLDTAPGYGDIEQRLRGLIAGRPFAVVTKIPGLPADIAPGDAGDFVRRSLETSRERLGERMAGVLFHSPDDLAGPCGAAAWDAAEQWCGRQAVPLGLSGYDPQIVAEFAGQHRVAMAQVPANAFDQRLAEEHERLTGIEITARSAFLQGLLLMDEARAAQRLPAAAGPLRAWRDLCQRRGSSPVVTALGIIKAIDGIDFCAVGVETTDQLSQIVAAWEAAEPIAAPSLASADERVIDPRKWDVVT